MSKSIILDDKGRITLSCELCREQYQQNHYMSFSYKTGVLPSSNIAVSIQFHRVMGEKMRLCPGCYMKIFDSLAGGEEECHSSRKQVS